MGIWQGHIFLAFNKSLEIFTIPTFESPHGPFFHFGSQSVYFPMEAERHEIEWIDEAHLNECQHNSLETMSTPHSDIQDSLYISIRNRDFVHRSLYMIRLPGEAGFSWHEHSKIDNISPCVTLKHCVGPTLEYHLHIAYTEIVRYPIIMELIRRSGPTTTMVDYQCENRVLSISGLPSLELTSVMDFDDGAGIILLGSCRGEISVVQFVDRSLRTRGSFLDDLPVLCRDLKELVRVCY